eukprot:TRINITY_DN6669_c0_g1_i3.p1 TRINITY_DN6669_c0_g1~~TRINITY_DN6669_c0_g1_i3.p1  ORF type:complete len:143 (+),score=51.87 TRINITY_DN6669_c0_g1_i3:367-795(+)
MSAADLTITARCYNSAMFACAQAKHVNKALQLFAAMQRARVPPTVHTYGVLLSACKLARSADVLVPRLCADMKSRGIPMTQTCASNAIRALACTGHLVAAQNFYRRLHVDYGINPSAFTSTMMASALLDEGRPRRAANILHE